MFYFNTGAVLRDGLNPCCNGRGSKTPYRRVKMLNSSVLILVVMEEGQRQGGEVRNMTISVS